MDRGKIKEIINYIFNYIDKGIDVTEYTTYKGHPALYFFHSKEEFNKKLDSLLIKNLYDKYDLYYITQSLIKFLLGKYDSHTKIWFEDQVAFPIKFKMENNKIYIVNTIFDYEDAIGGEIISINSIPITQILKELDCIICYSTLEYFKELSTDYIRQIKILKSLPSINNDCKIFTYKANLNGKEHDLVFDSDYKYKNYNEKKIINYTFEIIDNIIVIHYNSCRDRVKMNELIKDIKLEKAKRNIRGYIVDLRDNNGGDSTIVEPLIEYLTGENVVTLVNGNVFSSGELAMVDLKQNGSYIIGTDIGTSKNYFGESPGRLYLKEFGLVVKKSCKYWYCDNDYNYNGYTKGKFFEKFKDKNGLLEPMIIKPDEYVYISVEDILNNNDPQLNRAIDYIKSK